MALGFDGPVGAISQEAVGQERAACFPAHLDDTVLVQPCADVVVSRPSLLFTSNDASLCGEVEHLDLQIGLHLSVSVERCVEVYFQQETVRRSSGFSSSRFGQRAESTSGRSRSLLSTQWGVSATLVYSRNWKIRCV